ncbi:MAG: FtsX-like permease family protein [Bacteroidota bacterium]
MIFNLLKVAFRNIRKEKFFSILNIMGLAVGTCCVLFITLYISDELTFDSFHQNADRIYRINQTFIWGEDSNLFGSTGPAVADAVRSEIPEFEEVTRAHTPGALSVSYEQKQPYKIFDETGVLAVDSNFFSVFTFPSVEGNQETMLDQPNSVVLTMETKEKYFGKENAMGELLWIGEKENRKAYQVTGILQDVPTNSHVDFDMLISMSSIPAVKKRNWSWIWTTFVTFGLLNEDADVAEIQLAERLAEAPRKHAGVSLKRLQNMTFEEWEADGKEWKLYSQPLLDIHLHSTNVYSRLNNVSDIKMIYIFGTIGVLILIMCLINFVNLTTARSFGRAKEIGIRKVVGSSKGYLVFQFLTESILISAIAIMIGAFMAEWLMPLFNSLSGKELSFAITEKPLWALLLILSPVLLGTLAGLYPAFFMTSFATLQSLKNKVGDSKGNGGLRNALVVVQFTFSIIFIASTVIVFNQLSFQKNLDLGFNRDNKLIIERIDRLGEASAQSFIDKLEQISQVQTVTVSDATPPQIYNFDNFSLKGSDQSEFPVNYIIADEKFTEAYELKLMAGRPFKENFNESNRGLVNEAMVRFLGFQTNEEAVGEKLLYYGQELEIIGIIGDFNMDFSPQIRPFAIFAEDSELFSFPGRHISVAFREDVPSDELMGLINGMEQEWTLINGNAPFNYAFLDQRFESVFRSTLLFGKILSTFSILAVFIAILGMIGLITYVIQKRSKEIGVRKVLGASVTNILFLLSSRFGTLLLIAFVISIPLTWYGMDIWLQDFAQRRQIQIYDFLIGGLLMMFITVVATSYQTIRASLTNPINVLKDE